MINVLEILVSLEGSGGVQKRLLDNYLNMDRNRIHMDFIVHDPQIGELEEIVTGLGSKVFHVARKKGISLFKNVIQTGKVLKQEKYDIIQCHMERGSIITLLIALLYRVPVRITHTHLAHFDGNRKVPGFIYLLISKIIVRCSTDYFACSKDAGCWLFGEGLVNEGKLRVVPNAIDVEQFKYNPQMREKYRKEFGFSTKDTVLVDVGRFTSQKNHKFLIDIFDEFIKIEHNAKLVLVGDGELQSEIEIQIHEKGLTSNIIFTGSRDDVNYILQACDVFVHPALFEGLGNVLIEAQAAGLYVVTSKDVIPIETKIAPNIQYISLSKSAKFWSDTIALNYRYKRKDSSQLVRNAGFDCKQQAKILEDFLIKRAKENN